MAKNLTEIASALSKRYADVTNKKALDIARFVVAQMIQGVVDCQPDSRDRLVIAGFGNLGVKKTAARQVRNITTGEMVDVPEGVRIIFRPTDFLKKAVLEGSFDPAQVGVAAVEAETEAPAEEKAEEAAPAPKKPKKAKAEETIDTEDIPDITDL